MKIPLMAAAVLVQTSWIAWAHGDARWIQEGKFRSATGVGCCGVHDCNPVRPISISRTAAGYTIEIEVNRQRVRLEYPEGSTHGSEDGQVWQCALRCLFLPPSV